MVIEIAVFIFGLTVGSFLNVCIYRIPKGLSVFKPSRSFCPSCGRAIRWHDNIPLLSFLILRGRCRYCKEPISVRYPLVELLTAVIFSLLLRRYGFTAEFIGYCLLSAMLIAVSFIDLSHYIIPNKITLPGMGLGLAFAAVLTLLHHRPSMIVNRAVGLVVGGGVILLMSLIGSLIFRREAMGMGDVKLTAMIGAFMGFYPHVILVILLSAVMGSVVGGGYMLIRRVGLKSAIPYGPFLSAAAIISTLYGEELWRWYVSLL
ncbi:TPA: prepilin peptidase [Candidatus Poribacteria bacterium]|nr:prepilin peptidase [Candidatus Poribacteria bacterium]